MRVRGSAGVAAIATVVLGLATVPAHAQCAADSDCKAGRTCQHGQCAARECGKDKDCPGDAVCDSGRCRPMAAAAGTGPAAAVPPAAATAPPAGTVAPAPPATSPAPGPAPTAAPIPSAFPVPPQIGGGETHSEGILGLIIAGPIALGVAWLTTIAVTGAVAADKDRSEATGYAAIPLVGPWVMMGSHLDTSDYRAPLVISGIVQTSGLIMLVLGLAIRHDVSDSVYAFSDAPDSPTLALSPALLGRAGAGLVGVGTF
jgi:hypothetical protein